MEKVVLTESQAIEIENFKKLGHSLEDWVNNKNNPREPHSVIYELSLDEMARVLYRSDSYVVVQPDFKAGDKIIWSSPTNNATDFCELDRERTGESSRCWWCTDGEFVYENSIRHATPEEIYWLETLGREKLFDFREGDAILDIHGDFTPINTEFQVNHAVSYFSNKTKNLKGVYPAESFKRYPQEDE